jgi:hypothetical protein
MARAAFAADPTIASPRQPAPPAAPAPAPTATASPNASRVTAKVLTHCISGSAISPSARFHSLMVMVLSSEPASPGGKNLAQQGAVIDAQCAEAPTNDVVGANVQATLTLTGDAQPARWWISDLRVMP